ncbi:MAG: EFR1 family ferrodoxin [Candidatus Cloacimonadales bacterium]|nr:EFR1 family ferrodoxin [Candidatus Cloacimonadales bacterium]
MNKIFYFTGSGNSLTIAKRIDEKIEDCEVIQVKSSLDFSKPIAAEILGFVFPVYAWGMPVMFKEFIQKIKIEKADYVFVVTNYGGSCGNVLGIFRKILRKKGIEIAAFGEVVMPSNYVVMGDASSQHKAANILQIAEPVIDDLVQKISEKQAMPMIKVKFSGKFLSAVVYPLFVSNIRKSDKNFFFTETCNGCGICAKVCPAENIVLNEKKQPVWQHRCEQCHACFHWCPQRAIEFSKKTVQKNRYTHPNVKVSELF